MIKIVVDSGCDFPNDVKRQIINKENNIEIVPLTLEIDDKRFVDDDKLDTDLFVELIDTSPSCPKTAAPSPGSYLEKFQGKESVFAVTLSSVLSGSYNSAILAKQLFYENKHGGENTDKKFIHVFDSLSASVGEMQIAYKINEFYKNNFSENEIIEAVNNFIQNMKTYFILEKYDTAVKTGRMNPYVAKIASLLSIVPICAGIKGKMVVIDKARGSQKAVGKLIEIMQKEGTDFENKILGISHVKCLEKANHYKDEILKKIHFKDVVVCEASGLVSNYASKGGLVFAF